MTPEDIAALDKSHPRLKGVHPRLAEQVCELCQLTYEKHGFLFEPWLGLRTWEEQNALYDLGRSVKEVDGRPQGIVTNARGGQSWHNYGLAVDIVEDADPVKRGRQNPYGHEGHYIMASTFAAQVGLEAGAHFKRFRDLPHYQMTCGLSIAKCGAIYAKHDNPSDGIEAVWAVVWDDLDSLFGPHFDGSH